MDKGLKALEEIIGYYDDAKLYCVKKQIKIVRKELKRLEELEKRYDELLYTLNDINNERVDLLEVKKAVDLIKEKKVNCYLFIDSENLKDYNGCVDDITEKRLTEEEYDLLKEVFSD